MPNGGPQPNSDTWQRLGPQSNRRDSSPLFRDIDRKLAGRSNTLGCTVARSLELTPPMPAISGRLNTSPSGTHLILRPRNYPVRARLNCNNGRPGFGLQLHRLHDTLTGFAWPTINFITCGLNIKHRTCRNSVVGADLFGQCSFRAIYRGLLRKQSEITAIQAQDATLDGQNLHRVQVNMGYSKGVSAALNIGVAATAGIRLDRSTGKDTTYETHCTAASVDKYLSKNILHYLTTFKLPSWHDPINVQMHDKLTFHTTGILYCAALASAGGLTAATQLITHGDQMVSITRDSAHFMVLEFTPSVVHGKRGVLASALGTQLSAADYDLALMFSTFRVDVRTAAGLAAYHAALQGRSPISLWDTHGPRPTADATLEEFKRTRPNSQRLGVELVSVGTLDTVQKRRTVQQYLGMLPCTSLPWQMPLAFANEYSEGTEKVIKIKKWESAESVRTETTSIGSSVNTFRWKGGLLRRSTVGVARIQRTGGKEAFKDIILRSQYVVDALDTSHLERTFLQPLRRGSCQDLPHICAEGSPQTIVAECRVSRAQLLKLNQFPPNHPLVHRAMAATGVDPLVLTEFIAELQVYTDAHRINHNVPHGEDEAACQICLEGYLRVLGKFVEAHGEAAHGVVCHLLNFDVGIGLICSSDTYPDLRTDIDSFIMRHVEQSTAAGHTVAALLQRVGPADCLLARITALSALVARNEVDTKETLAELRREIRTHRTAIAAALCPADSEVQAALYAHLNRSGDWLMRSHAEKMLVAHLQPERVYSELKELQRLTDAKLIMASDAYAHWCSKRRVQRRLQVLRRMARRPGLLKADLCQAINETARRCTPALARHMGELVQSPMTRQRLWRNFSLQWLGCADGWSLLVALLFAAPRPVYTLRRASALPGFG
jgi:hypothetical protein